MNARVDVLESKEEIRLTKKEEAELVRREESAARRLCPTVPREGSARKAEGSSEHGASNLFGEPVR